MNAVSHNWSAVQFLHRVIGPLDTFKNDFGYPQMFLILGIEQNLHLLDLSDSSAHVR